MFENFSFQTPYRHNVGTSEEDNISPLSQETSSGLRVFSDQASSYASPPPSPLQSDRPSLRERRAFSVSTHLESLRLRDTQSPYLTPPTSASQSTDSINSYTDYHTIPELKLSIRSQRQNMTRWQLDDSQRKRLADLVEDMVNNELDCSVRNSPLPSPPIVTKELYFTTESSETAPEDLPKEASSVPHSTASRSHCHRGHTDGSIRKGWSTGASHHGVCGSCGRSMLQRKLRTRKSLASITGQERPAQEKPRRSKEAGRKR